MVDEKKNDIHALKLILDLVFDIAVPIVEQVKKDGYQTTDLIAFLSSEEFRADFIDLLDELKEVPLEIKDLDSDEAIELTLMAVLKIKDLVKAFKAKA